MWETAMGRTGKPKMQIALMLPVLAVIVRLILVRIREGASHGTGMTGILVSAAVSLALVTVALTVQWRGARRK